jgi:hypothetical protein
MVKRPQDREGVPTPATDGTFHHGRDEAAAWLRMLGLHEPGRWHVEVALQASAGSQFQLNVYAEEWGFAFSHARRSSWIRVTDVPFVHGRDDFGLIRRLPALAALGTFLAELESEHEIKLLRSSVRVRSNVQHATAAVRRWLQRARGD